MSFVVGSRFRDTAGPRSIRLRDPWRACCANRREFDHWLPNCEIARDTLRSLALIAFRLKTGELAWNCVVFLTHSVARAVLMPFLCLFVKCRFELVLEYCMRMCETLNSTGRSKRKLNNFINILGRLF